MPADAAVAAAFLIGWIGLAVGMFFGYRWLRDSERDTLLAEEAGLEPRLEAIGSGRINQRQWSTGRGCRVSIYDDFFVISVSSTRRKFPLYLVREVAPDPETGRVNIKALAEDESLVSIDFRGPDAARLAEYLCERGRGGPKLAGTT